MDPYRFDPAAHIASGTILHGPAPAPQRITSPRVHTLSTDAPYADTQTTDGIATGDILLSGDTVGIMMEAWPILVSGDELSTGFHTLAADADLAALGAEPWGRRMDMRYFPVDGPKEGVPFTDHIAPRGGYDLSESFDLARKLANAGI